MFLQRLIADPKIGFNYDDMGYAEFENGSTRKSRVALAKLIIDHDMSAKKVRLFERFGRSLHGPFEVFIFGQKDYIKGLGSRSATDPMLDDIRLDVQKSSMRLDNKNILGWMSVHPYEKIDPLFIIRTGEDNVQRGDTFLRDFIDGILEDEKKADEQLIYQYANGWTLRRADGPIVLPQNDGIAIDAAGQWVMFDQDGKPIDRDKYHSDIVERFQRRIGEPLSPES
jgi:hypothetical protein